MKRGDLNLKNVSEEKLKKAIKALLVFKDKCKKAKEEVFDVYLIYSEFFEKRPNQFEVNANIEDIVDGIKDSNLKEIKILQNLEDIEDYIEYIEIIDDNFIQNLGFNIKDYEDKKIKYLIKSNKEQQIIFKNGSKLNIKINDEKEKEKDYNIIEAPFIQGTNNTEILNLNCKKSREEDKKNNDRNNLIDCDNNSNDSNNENEKKNLIDSINDNKKDKNKNYIKVNKNKKKNNNSHLKINVNGEENERKKSNRYISKTDMNNKIYRINKITKLKIINDYKKKHKNNFNFNKEQILKINEIKNNLNSINYNKEKNHIKNLSKTTDNSMLYNSPKNNFEFKGISKLQKYINNHIQLNINKNNNKNCQISNIKRNIKEIILNRDNRKDNRKDNSANNDLLDDINNSISNVNENNISYSIGNNNNIFKMNEKSALLIKNSRKKRIINYNSFNNSKNSKHSISLNDPHLFFKSPKTKNFIFGKQNKNNANGSIDKIK